MRRLTILLGSAVFGVAGCNQGTGSPAANKASTAEAANPAPKFCFFKKR
jgi:hypothetical protein